MGNVIYKPLLDTAINHLAERLQDIAQTDEDQIMPPDLSFIRHSARDQFIIPEELIKPSPSVYMYCDRGFIKELDKEWEEHVSDIVDEGRRRYRNIDKMGDELFEHSFSDRDKFTNSEQARVRKWFDNIYYDRLEAWIEVLRQRRQDINNHDHVQAIDKWIHKAEEILKNRYSRGWSIGSEGLRVWG